jgi:hypothetical protein
MTRLLHGFTILAGTCALTLVVGCGGSSTPKVNCDGGACGDAKHDTSGTKYDGSTVTPGHDGPTFAADGPTVTPGPDGPVTQAPDGPVTQAPDGPVTQAPDGPVTQAPDGSTAAPDGEEPIDTTTVKAEVQPDVRLDAPASPDVAQDIAAILYDSAPDVIEDALEAGEAGEAGEVGEDAP